MELLRPGGELTWGKRLDIVKGMKNKISKSGLIDKKIEDEIDRRVILKAWKERHKAVPLEKIREKYGL
jgi:hypothetical protein